VKKFIGGHYAASYVYVKSTVNAEQFAFVTWFVCAASAVWVHISGVG
jgi:hypothetical protein